MKPHIYKYVKQCRSCQQRNRQIVKYVQGQFKVPTTPMEFISMDLIDEFHPPSSKGHKYALTVICMLTGYTFCIPLKTKTAAEVVKAYVDNVYAKFGGSLKSLVIMVQSLRISCLLMLQLNYVWSIKSIHLLITHNLMEG